MEIAPNISVDADIHHGEPVITGTRVPVALVLGSLRTMSREEVMREYDLTDRDIQASLAYAVDLVSSTSVVAFAGL
jgi:uncharacterized protein (DUF433 family)